MIQGYLVPLVFIIEPFRMRLDCQGIDVAIVDIFNLRKNIVLQRIPVLEESIVSQIAEAKTWIPTDMIFVKPFGPAEQIP